MNECSCNQSAAAFIVFKKTSKKDEAKFDTIYHHCPTDNHRWTNSRGTGTEQEEKELQP